MRSFWTQSMLVIFFTTALAIPGSAGKLGRPALQAGNSSCGKLCGWSSIGMMAVFAAVVVAAARKSAIEIPQPARSSR